MPRVKLNEGDQVVVELPSLGEKFQRRVFCRILGDGIRLNDFRRQKSLDGVINVAGNSQSVSLSLKTKEPLKNPLNWHQVQA
jgi:hypothetical protein